MIKIIAELKVYNKHTQNIYEKNVDREARYFHDDFVDEFTCSIAPEEEYHSEQKYHYFGSVLRELCFEEFYKGFKEGVRAGQREYQNTTFFTNEDFPRGIALPSFRKMATKDLLTMVNLVNEK